LIPSQQHKQKTNSASVWEYAFTRTGATILSVILFAGLIWTTGFLEDQQKSRVRSEQENELLRELSILTANLESALNAKLYLAKGLSAMVHANPNFNEATFQKFASELAHGVGSVKSLQLSPNAVVTHVWPHIQNKDAIGDDLLADPDRRDTAEKAIVSKGMWLTGPLNLITGGEALIGRLPVFLERNGQDFFWGFASILLDFPSLLKEVGITEFAAKNQLAIRGRNGSGENGEVFLGNPSIFNTGSLLSNIQLPSGSWLLGTLPRMGWINTWPDRSRNRQIAFFASMLVALIGYSLLRLPSILKRSISRATQALSKSERQFRDAIEALPDGFAIFESDHRLAVVNAQLQSRYHTVDQNLGIGDHYKDLWHAEIRTGRYLFENKTKEVEFLNEQLTQRARNEFSTSRQLKCADGSWLQISESPMRDGGVVAYYRDITELIKKEQQLTDEKIRAETANRSKTDFLATISHELRTPLNAVLGLLGLMTEDKNLNNEQKEFITTAYSSAKHLLSLLNELLDISKMEADKLELDQASFSPYETLDNVINLLRGNATQKSLKLVRQIDSQLHTLVLGDQGRVRQIVLNLIGNAIKFTDSGSVQLNARCIEKHAKLLTIEIEVIDTGIGFDPEIATDIFEPFAQVDSSAVRRFSGTGLGLAICKRLVEKMEGEIWANSSGKNGSVFTVRLTLPIAESQVQIPEVVHNMEISITPRDLGWRTMRVLLAEDNATNRMVIQAMLQDSGYHIDIAHNGLEAIQIATELAFDLILMDIQMPEMDGLTATKALRSNQKFSDIPIIGLSANAMSGSKEEMLSAGMTTYLTKPVEKQRLLKTMIRCLQAPASQRS
jgi:signal transduction histidine kinase/sensor domain CHASE-containing protein/CheY-like chemotaxis protein